MVACSSSASQHCDCSPGHWPLIRAKPRVGELFGNKRIEDRGRPIGCAKRSIIAKQSSKSESKSEQFRAFARAGVLPVPDWRSSVVARFARAARVCVCPDEPRGWRNDDYLRAIRMNQISPVCRRFGIGQARPLDGVWSARVL